MTLLSLSVSKERREVDENPRDAMVHETRELSLWIQSPDTKLGLHHDISTVQCDVLPIISYLAIPGFGASGLANFIKSALIFGSK